jgi:hypothetical protein
MLLLRRVGEVSLAIRSVCAGSDSALLTLSDVRLTLPTFLTYQLLLPSVAILSL